MKMDITIELEADYEVFVEDQIKDGKFKNAQEVLYAGLRLLKDIDSKALYIKNELNKGIESGIYPNFEPNSFLHFLKSRKNNAKL